MTSVACARTALYREAKRFRGLEIDDEIEFGRLDYR